MVLRVSVIVLIAMNFVLTIIRLWYYEIVISNPQLKTMDNQSEPSIKINHSIYFFHGLLFFRIMSCNDISSRLDQHHSR